MSSEKVGEYEPLSRGARWLLVTFAGATTAGAFASLFVSLFVFVVTDQLTQLALFNGAYFFSLTFVFYLVAFVFRQKTPLVPYRWGLVLTAGFFGLLVLLAHQAVHVLVPLGLFYGLGQGFFWFGANLMTFDTVPAKQRIRFYGYNSAVGSIAGVTGPLAGGFLVSVLPGIKGYLLVFLLTLVLYSVTFIASWGVPPGPRLGYGPLRLSLELPRLRPLWRLAFKTLTVRGTREAMTGLAGVYLVYVATRQPWAVGVYGAVTALARMLGALGVARRVTPPRRVAAMVLGMAGMTASALVLVAGQAWPYVFTYGVVMSFAMPWFTIPNEAIPLDVMDSDVEVGQRRVAYILSREIGLNAGRLASLLLLVGFQAVVPAGTALIALLVGTSAAQSWVVAAGGRIWSQLPPPPSTSRERHTS